MLQRQILFKQLQEMQQQQQLQEQNFVNQLPFSNKQTSAGIHPALINGMPVHDATQMFMMGNMHLAQHSTSPIIQGVPNGLLFSQAQNQAIGSNGVLLQKFDSSLYGTTFASSGINMNPYSCMQGASHDSARILNRDNSSQLEIASNSFVNEQFNVSPRKFCIADGAFVPKNVTEDKNMFGQLLMHASDDGILSANFQQLQSLQMNTAMKEPGMRQQQSGCSVISAGTTSNLHPSHSATSLDPLEEKILFSTDDDSWGSSLCQQSNVDSTGEHVDFSSMFSSHQNGSWSALMQSAVAEVSSSDTGQQEEWSGLTFQNPELSADNQQINYIGDGNQSSCVDNNLQSISSPTSKPEVSFQNSNTNSFPTFQQSHNVFRPKEGMHSDSSHESVQQSPKNGSKWFERNLQQKQTVEGCQLVQTPHPLQNAWHDQQSENSKNDRHQLSMSPYALGGQSGYELKGNMWLHESGSQPMVGASQRPPDQAPHSWSNQEQGYVGQFNYVDDGANIGMSSEKVLSADFPMNSRVSEELPPRNNVDSMAALFDSSADFSGQNIISHRSGDTVDLLNKAEKSIDIRSGAHLGSRDSVPLSQAPQIENSNLYYNPSASQGFSLRLAPPSQQMPKSYSSLGSPLLGSSSVINASGPLYLNNQLKNQYQLVTPVASQSPHAALPALTGIFEASIATSGDSSDMFQTSIQGQKFPTLETLPVTQPSSTSGVPQQIKLSMGLPNMSQGVPGQPDVLQSEVPSVFSNSIPSPDSSNSNSYTARGAPHQQYEQMNFQNGDNIREINAHLQTTQAYDCEEDQVNQLNLSGVLTPLTHNTLDHGHKAVGKHLTGANVTTSIPVKTTTHHQVFDRVEQRDNNTPNVSVRGIDAFDSFLNSHGQQQNFTPLYQVNANARQQFFYGLKSGVTNLALGDPNSKLQLNSISSRENKPMTYSSEASGNQPGKFSSQAFMQDSGILVFGERGDGSHSKEQSQINVQMAPSWFEHYRSTKNGHIPSMYDLIRTKDAAKQFSIGQINSSIASQPSSILPDSAAKIVTAKQVSSTCLMPSDDSERNVAVLTPKKRKLAAFDLLPWHKEVNKISEQPQKDSSMAEFEWALASNRLVEKVEDEAEMMEDILPISQPKKRLVLTTQLTQQVFRPVPAVILSADACSNSESIVYFVARLALGDACSMTSGFEKSPLTSDVSSKNLRASERVGRLDFSEAAENFIDRAKRLGNELLRLDKNMSIVDIKVDSQELERFSVINRFAKFHSRGHSVSVNTLSSSGANPAIHKASPQRYVVAHPMPKVVPEGVNCISL
ncbi:hypothetical protein ACH5RR_014229 [Cinchona calisaya]|uniref:Uncharacterized protein n=1 Tax=Cinchona calisaya TaxID=153742 RepID=A0ABD3A5X9_9GENT